MDILLKHTNNFFIILVKRMSVSYKINFIDIISKIINSLIFMIE